MLFALFATLAVLLLATIMPPYQNPDELAHFLRADQVSHGGLLARDGPAAKARIDTGIMASIRPFWDMPHSPQMHVDRSMYAPVPWGGRQVFGSPNTALYPPVFYLPAAAAIRLAKQAGLGVLPALEMGRAAQGLTAVALGALAIALAGPAAVWLFAVLTLPMCLAQMAALGQDGPMIASVALAVALALRLQDGGARHRRLCFAALAVVLVLVGSARPPYAAFALLVLLATGIGRWLRVLALVGVVTLVGVWCWLSLAVSGVDPGHFNGSDARAQALGLLRAPWRVFGLAAETYAMRGADYGEQFLGKLGWFDVEVPYSLRVCAGVSRGGPEPPGSAALAPPSSPAAAAAATGTAIRQATPTARPTPTSTPRNHGRSSSPSKYEIASRQASRTARSACVSRSRPASARSIWRRTASFSCISGLARTTSCRRRAAHWPAAGAAKVVRPRPTARPSHGLRVAVPTPAAAPALAPTPVTRRPVARPKRPLCASRWRRCSASRLTKVPAWITRLRRAGAAGEAAGRWAGRRGGSLGACGATGGPSRGTPSAISPAHPGACDSAPGHRGAEGAGRISSSQAAITAAATGSAARWSLATGLPVTAEVGAAWQSLNQAAMARRL